MTRNPHHYTKVTERIRETQKLVQQPRLPVTAWKQLDLLNGWSNFDVTAYAPAAAFRDAHGVVHLRGLIAGGQLGITNPLALVDASMRPEYRTVLGTICNGVAAARVDADPAGNLAVITASSTTWVSLEGLSYRSFFVQTQGAVPPGLG